VSTWGNSWLQCRSRFLHFGRIHVQGQLRHQLLGSRQDLWIWVRHELHGSWRNLLSKLQRTWYQATKVTEPWGNEQYHCNQHHLHGRSSRIHDCKLDRGKRHPTVMGQISCQVGVDAQPELHCQTHHQWILLNYSSLSGEFCQDQNHCSKRRLPLRH